MDVSVEELAAFVGGRVASGFEDKRGVVLNITGAASIADAGEQDVTFFGNAKYLQALKTSRAACVLVPEGFQEAIPSIPILVANPAEAFSRLLARLAPPPIVFAPGIHATAVIGEGVQLGSGVSVQPHAVIEPGAVIGNGSFIGAGVYIGHEAKVGVDCTIYPNSTIRERCILGNRVIVHSGVVIGSDGFGYEMAGGRYVKVPQTGIVQIDDDVEIGANANIDRARFGRTWVKEGTKIDNLSQIAHNVVIGKHVIVASLVGISGSSRVGDYAMLGGQVGVVGHIEIGDRAIVGAQGGVSKSIPAGQYWWGTPACPMDEFKVRHAHAARLPKLAERVKRLEQLLDSKPKENSPSESA